MAVVESLNVVLSLVTGKFSEGATKARKDLRTLEGQASRTRDAFKKLQLGRSGFGRFGGRLGPLGIGAGGLTAIGLGFAAKRFTQNSLKAFSETPEGKDLKATMDGLNASVKQIEVSF